MALGAIALAYLGEKERTKEWASRALTIEPDDVADHYNIACAFAQMGEPDQALDLLDTNLRRVPPNTWAAVSRTADVEMVDQLDDPYE